MVRTPHADTPQIKLKDNFKEFGSGGKLVRYKDTPVFANLSLGVVGYPGDREFGAYMYEHWADVQIDLARSRGVLEYKVDTTGGQSGSPVFTSDLTAIGVHVRGGWPNSASSIGTLGNIFAEYLVAMKVHAGGNVLAGTKIVDNTMTPPAPNFQMISVTSLAQVEPASGAAPAAATAARSAVPNGVPTTETVGDDDVAQMSKLLLKILKGIVQKDESAIAAERAILAE